MSDEARTQSFLESSGTSLSLIEQLRKRGKASDWERLVQIYSPMVYRICRISGLQACDSADIVQDVFTSVYRSLPDFRNDRPTDTFRGWLLTITKNKIRDHLRNRARTAEATIVADAQRRVEQLHEVSWDSSTNDVPFNSKSALLTRVVDLVRNDFEEKTWQAFWRVTAERQAAKDVAEQLKMSKWSVYQAKSRVLSRIRQELGRMEVDLE